MSMARSGLSVYLYNPPGTSYYGAMTLEIGGSLTNLSFGSASPGGYTDFSATLPLRDGRFPLAALQMFSQIEVKSGLTVVWAGELSEPLLSYNETQGEYIQLTGLGYGNALRDCLITGGYNNKTVQQIAVSVYGLLTGSTAGTLLSADTTYLFPDNPATLFSPAYDNRTVEDILADLVALAGDYHWGVWAHPALGQINGAGFRLGVVEAHQRDTATTHYSASLAERDFVSMTVGPSAERAYNSIRIDCNGSNGVVASVFYTDSRLGAGNSQGSAPFRRRTVTRDYSGISTITTAQAQSIANTYGAIYQNPTNKFSASLRRVRDDKGMPVALAELQADRNIFVRDLAQRSTGAMPLAPTAGVNQFYIVSASYREDASGMQVDLEGDNFQDRTETQVARLTLAADVKARSGKTTGITQQANAPANGAAVIGQSNASAGANCTGPLYWVNALYFPPTGVAFTQVTRTNLNTPTATSMVELGGVVQASAVASGGVVGLWTYTTSGNCIRAIHGKTIDWHCDGCGKEFTGLSINEHVRIVTATGVEPGRAALAIDCPECAGFTESWNTNLRAADETHPTHTHRAEQARLIRQLMRHGAVLLDTRD